MPLFQTIALGLCLSILCLPTRGYGDVVDLLIVSGQSNAVGYDARGELFKPAPSDKEVLFWYRCGDPPPDEFDIQSGAWITLQAQPKGTPMSQGRAKRQYGNFSHASGGFGPEIGFARAMQAAEPDTRFAVLKVAFSGTRMRDDWAQPDGPCWKAMVEEFEKATLAAKAKGIELRPRGFAWVQGESDANAGDAKKYAARYTEFAASLRGLFKEPNLPIMPAINVNFGGGKNKFMRTVIAQQKAFAAKDSQARYVDTKGLSIANVAHLDAEGTLDTGKLFAEALLAIEAEAEAKAGTPAPKK